MNCVDKLLPFVENFSKLGSFEGEYHYLLGKSYEKQNNAIMALKHYHEVRNGIVYDTKVRLSTDISTEDGGGHLLLAEPVNSVYSYVTYTQWRLVTRTTGRSPPRT